MRSSRLLCGLIVLAFLGCGGSEPEDEPPPKKPPKKAVEMEDDPGSSKMSEPNPDSTSLVSPTRPHITDIAAGTGPTAEEGQTLIVSYKISLTSGKVVEEGEKHEFVFGDRQVVPGWEVKGLKNMKVGGKRKVILPGEWGYGHQEYKGKMPAGVKKFDTLIIEFELLGIK